MIRSKNHQFALRLEMVFYARRHGIRPAERRFAASRNTVRKWLRRFEEKGKAGLVEQSRAPKNCPHKTHPNTERKIIRVRRQTNFSPRRLKDEFEIHASVGAIARIIRQHALGKKQRRKPHRKTADRRAEKLALPPFTYLQMDTKDLSDIPNYRRFIHQLGLPRYQFTIRDCTTGAQFLDYAPEATVHYAALTAKRALKHLQHCGVDLGLVKMTTDNGSEFSGNRLDHSDRGFVHAVQAGCGIRHIFNPPHSPNSNPDVESAHNTIEHEFFDLETFSSFEEFKSKVTAYQNYYNIARLNYSKGKRSPLDILVEKQTSITETIFLLPPSVYGRMPNRCRSHSCGVGHDVPAPVENLRV
jgi:transposase